MSTRRQTPARLASNRRAWHAMKARRLAAGLCVRCGAARSQSQYRCDTCVEQARREQRARLLRDPLNQVRVTMNAIRKAIGKPPIGRRVIDVEPLPADAT